MNQHFNISQNPLAILYICGEAECHGTYPNFTFISNIAQKFSAIVFSLEHRFYGNNNYLF